MNNNEQFETAPVDNVESAMAKVAETITPTRKPNTGAEEGSTATKQVLIRTTEEDHAYWKRASDKENITLSEFLRNAANKMAIGILECSHPSETLKWFPWGTRCTKCGVNIK